MRVRAMYIAVAAVCLFAACKKNNGSNGGVNGGTNFPKLKMYIEEKYAPPSFNEKDSFTMTYDNNGRLTAMTGKEFKYAYTYSSGSDFMMDMFVYGEIS